MGTGLFEIRAAGKEGIGREFFCAAVGRNILILHEFIKKSKKPPVRELETDRKRLKEIQHERYTKVCGYQLKIRLVKRD